MSKTILILLLLQVSCSPLSLKRFTAKDYITHKQCKYEITIPRNHTNTLRKRQFPNHTIFEYAFSNGASIYVNLDISYADSPNLENWSKCSNPEKKYKCEQGVQEDGRLWREITKYYLVVGYHDVPKEEKEKFDKAIESLTLVKTEKCK